MRHKINTALRINKELHLLENWNTIYEVIENESLEESEVFTSGFIPF